MGTLVLTGPADASERLCIEKVFEQNSSDDTPRGYRIDSASVPFCPRCLEQHRGAETECGSAA